MRIIKQDQKRLDNIAKAYWNTSGEIREMWGRKYFIMAKIVQSLTRASKEYEQRTFDSLVRDLDSIVTKLNSSFQDEMKQEIESRSFFLGE